MGKFREFSRRGAQQTQSGEEMAVSFQKVFIIRTGRTKDLVFTIRDTMLAIEQHLPNGDSFADFAEWRFKAY